MKSATKYLIIILLVGCKAESVNVEPPDRLPDMVTDSGIFIYIETDDPSHTSNNPKYLSKENEEFRQKVEENWLEVQSCLDMRSDDPPVLIIVEDHIDWLKKRGVHINSKNGYARYEENLIVVNDNSTIKTTTRRHEFIHIILHQNGVPDNINSQHLPSYLWECQKSKSF